jgi:hypothetical protein
MGFFQKLFGGAKPARPVKRYYTFSVTCKRCGEVIEGRVDLEHDLSIEYEDDGEVFYSRKTLMGANKCFQRMEAEFKFSAARTLIDRQVSGGEFVS